MLADGAVDVGDRAARPADDVVVVVADPRLVARHRAGGLDAPHQPGGGQRAQHVVDGLVRDLAEIRAHDADDRVGVGVRMVVHRGQHRDPRAGHAQGGAAQQLLDSDVVGTLRVWVHDLEPVKSTGSRPRRGLSPADPGRRPPGDAGCGSLDPRRPGAADRRWRPDDSGTASPEIPPDPSPGGVRCGTPRPPAAHPAHGGDGTDPVAGSLRRVQRQQLELVELAGCGGQEQSGRREGRPRPRGQGPAGGRRPTA